MKIHLIHVAGTCMIDQGSDGSSRGNMLEGVMKGNTQICIGCSIRFERLDYIVAPGH